MITTEIFKVVVVSVVVIVVRFRKIYLKVLSLRRAVMMMVKNLLIIVQL